MPTLLNDYEYQSFIKEILTRLSLQTLSLLIKTGTIEFRISLSQDRLQSLGLCFLSRIKTPDGLGTALGFEDGKDNFIFLLVYQVHCKVFSF